MVKFGVVGYGYWGPNVVRNLDRLDEAEVVAVCDKSAAARKKVAKAYPDVLVTDDAAGADVLSRNRRHRRGDAGLDAL